MKRYQKKLAFEKVKHVLNSYKYVIVGRYDNASSEEKLTLWTQLKALSKCSLFVPKNSICRLSFAMQEKSKFIVDPCPNGKSNHASSEFEKQRREASIEAVNTLFEGPVFILSTNESFQVAPILSKLSQYEKDRNKDKDSKGEASSNSKMLVYGAVYGGFLEGNLLNFADINELHHLFKAEMPYSIPYTRMRQQTVYNWFGVSTQRIVDRFGFLSSQYVQKTESVLPIAP